MDVLPWRTQIYLGLVAAAALFAAAFALTSTEQLDSGTLALSGVLALVMLITWQYPLPLSFKASFYLDSIVIVAGILLLEPGPAILAFGLGTLAGQLLNRRLWDEMIFNTSQVMLQVAVGAGLLASAGWDPRAPDYGDLRLVLAVIISGFAVLLTNQILVGGIVSLQASMNPFDVWSQSVLFSSRSEILAHMAQVGLGIVSAHIAYTHPWMLFLFAFPIGALYSAAAESFEQRRRAEEAKRLGESALAEAQRVAAIGSWEWNLVHGGHVWSQEVYRILGREPGAVQPAYERLLEAVHPDDREELDRTIHRAIQRGEGFDLEHRLLVHGEEHNVQHRGEVIFDEEGRKIRMVATLHDISERKALEQRLHQLAYHDPLTGLANRAHFMERLEEALSSVRPTESLIGVLFIDLDNFKHANDQYGHEQGDALLMAVAERLQGAVRNTDVAARLGGDEFTVLVPELPSLGALETFAGRLVETLSEPVELEGELFKITASIGLYAALPGEVEAGEFLRRADAALYQAKRTGRNRYQVYDPAAPGPPGPESYREAATREEKKARPASEGSD